VLACSEGSEGTGRAYVRLGLFFQGGRWSFCGGFWEVGERGEVGEAPRRGSGKEWSAKEGSEGEGFTCMQASGAVAVHVREFVWYLCHRLPPPILWRRGRGVGTATLTAPLN
jgi:hypothetical protein